MNSEDRFSLTEPSYWESIWEGAEWPRPFDPCDRSVRNQGNLAFHRLFSDALQMLPGQGGSLIEIGCAQSKWLPYFHKEHGLSVTGLDYSAIGCARARTLLQRAQCQGEIIQGDLFNPPDALLSRFDVVLSMGLVEHFADTSAAIAACAALTRPGGIVITTIPNMTGVAGRIQKELDQRVYDKHVLLDCEALREAHEKCDLSIVRSEYLVSVNFGVINHQGLRSKFAQSVTRGILTGATAVVWAFERAFIRFPASQLFSPYIACVAIKADRMRTS